MAGPRGLPGWTILAAVAVLIVAAAVVWLLGERAVERAPDLSVAPIEFTDSSLVEPPGVPMPGPTNADDS